MKRMNKVEETKTLFRIAKKAPLIGKKMKLCAVILTTLLLVPSLTEAQASWTCIIDFTLVDENNNLIRQEQVASGTVRLYALPFPERSTLRYDTINNRFRFMQHTVIDEVQLTFVHRMDTTILNVHTAKFDLDTVRLTGNSYEMWVWFDAEEKFYETETPVFNKVYKNSYSFESYLATRKNHIKIDASTEVKLK